jgi:hypothetical protein
MLLHTHSHSTRKNKKIKVKTNKNKKLFLFLFICQLHFEIWSWFFKFYFPLLERSCCRINPEWRLRLCICPDVYLDKRKKFMSWNRGSNSKFISIHIHRRSLYIQSETFFDLKAGKEREPRPLAGRQGEDMVSVHDDFPDRLQMHFLICLTLGIYLHSK